MLPTPYLEMQVVTKKAKVNTLSTSISSIQEFPQTKTLSKLISTETNGGKYVPMYQNFKGLKP